MVQYRPRKTYVTDYDLSELIKSDRCFENSRGEFVVPCPICKARKDEETPGRDYGKLKKERKLNIEPTLTCGFCFVCNSTFLTKDRLARLKMPTVDSPLVIEEPEFISIPYTRPDPHNEESHKYLIERCPQLYKDADLSAMGFYCSNEKIVIVFKLNGDSYYYQLRYVDPEKSNNGIKYYMPVTGASGKPLYFAGGTYNPYCPTILVEGVFTALVEKLLLPGFNVVAVLGHYLTDFQLNQLKSLGMFNQVWVHMDEVRMSWDLKKSVPYPLSRNFKVLPNYSETLDSEEIIRKGMLTPEAYRQYLLGFLVQPSRLVVA